MMVQCCHRRPCQWRWPFIVRPWCTCHPPDEQLLISVGWVLRRPSSSLSFGSLSSTSLFSSFSPRPCPCPCPRPCPCPVIVIVVVVGGGGSFLAWCLPMSLLASNTHDPPCEQLLAGVGAGAGSSVVVGVFCGRFLLVALCCGRLSPFHLQSTPRAVARGAGGGWCVIRRCGWLWWGPGTRFRRRHLFWGGLGGSA
jgi:hypothetical protein